MLISFSSVNVADHEEGIYRLSGSTATIKELRDLFDTYGDVDLLAAPTYWDTHAVAGLLKLYLRLLPTSILTNQLHMDFLHVTDLIDRSDRIMELARLVSCLPLANYTLLRALVSHLLGVIKMSNINKMTISNVGIVFSPTLRIPAGIFTLMMTEFEFVFWVGGGRASTITEEGSNHLNKHASSSHPNTNSSYRNSDASNNRRSDPPHGNDNEQKNSMLEIEENAPKHLSIMEEDHYTSNTLQRRRKSLPTSTSTSSITDLVTTSGNVVPRAVVSGNTLPRPKSLIVSNRSSIYNDILSQYSQLPFVAGINKQFTNRDNSLPLFSKGSKRTSWRADQVEVSGRSNRNSMVYTDKAPDRMTELENRLNAVHSKSNSVKN